MALTVTVEGVDITNANPHGNSTVYDGRVRLKIGPGIGVDDEMSVNIRFEHAVSLVQGIAKALKHLGDYGDELKSAAQQAAANYK